MPFLVKNPRPQNVALIDPGGVLKCLCKNQQFFGVLEYWSDGVMENRSYAFFLPEQSTEKRKNIQILLSLPGINTPILQYSITPILQSVSIQAEPKNSDHAQRTWFSKTK
jgi:hypothetical protein